VVASVGADRRQGLLQDFHRPERIRRWHESAVGEFLFPLHDRWYSALQMNAPQNPVEEFSTREYGRFGFFFKKDLKRDAPLQVTYRFLIRNADAPAQAPKRSPEQTAAARREAEAAYAKFVSEVK
jgi:hypothetical protein